MFLGLFSAPFPGRASLLGVQAKWPLSELFFDPSGQHTHDIRTQISSSDAGTPGGEDSGSGHLMAQRRELMQKIRNRYRPPAGGIERNSEMGAMGRVVVGVVTSVAVMTAVATMTAMVMVTAAAAGTSGGADWN